MPLAYLFDRRMLGKTEERWGTPTGAPDGLIEPGIRCVRRFGRTTRGPGERKGDAHVTGSRMAKSNGHELLLCQCYHFVVIEHSCSLQHWLRHLPRSAYHADAVYKFSIYDDPGNAASSIRPVQSQSPILSPGRKRRKLRRTGQEPGSTSNHERSECTPQNTTRMPQLNPDSTLHETQETPDAHEDRDNDNAGDPTALPMAGTQNGDDIAQITGDVERFLEEYIDPRISDAEAARNLETGTISRDIASFHDMSDSSRGSEDGEEDSRSRHDSRSPPADEDCSSSSEDEMDIESEPDSRMEVDPRGHSSSQEPEDIGRTASLLQRFEDALVEDQEDEDEDDYHDESEAESDGAMEGSTKEGALANSWLAQPTVYPAQRYSGVMNVEVRRYSHIPEAIRLNTTADRVDCKRRYASTNLLDYKIRGALIIQYHIQSISWAGMMNTLHLAQMMVSFSFGIRQPQK